jgi:tripartite ATP-independent transporter DctP family solute receptor
MKETNHQKKGLMFFAIVVALCSLLLLSPGPGFAAKHVTLRLGHSESVTNIRHGVCLWFAKRANELSKGQVTIKIFPGGVMGTHTSCQEQVAAGTLDFYITTAGLVSVFDPKRTQELIELPYLFDSYSQAYAFMDTPFVTHIYDPLISKGIRYLATWDNGFRHVTNSVRPIHKPEDLEGLKIRVVKSDMSIHILRALGANPVPMSYSELYTALGQHVVDGQENPFMNIYASKFYEVQKYMSLTMHQYSTLPVIMSEKSWEKLTKFQQHAVLQACREAAPYMRRLVVANEGKQRAAMEKTGFKVNDIPDLTAFREKCEAVYKWAETTYPKDKVQETLQEVKKIREEYPKGKTYFGDEK